MFREVGLYSRGAHIKDFTVYQSSIEVEQYLQQRYLKNIKQPDQMNKIEIPLPYYPAYKHPHAHLLISRRYLSITRAGNTNFKVGEQITNFSRSIYFLRKH